MFFVARRKLWIICVLTTWLWFVYCMEFELFECGDVAVGGG